MKFGTTLRTRTYHHLLCHDCGVGGPDEEDRQGAIAAALNMGWCLDWKEEYAYCPEHAKERGKEE